MTAISVAPLSAMPLLKELPALLPELTLLVTAIGLLCADMFFPRARAFLQWLTVVGAITAFAAIVAVSAGGGSVSFDGMFRADGFGALFKAICVVALAFTALMSESFFSHAQMRQGEYYCLAVCSTLGMCVMASAGDLIVLYLGLELMALPIYAMAALRTGDPRSSESAIKYFLMGSFASALLLFGMSLLYGLTGHTELVQIAAALPVAATGQTLPALVVALALMLAGMGFKVAAAPFHVWVPDVYEGAPTTVTAFMSAAAKTASFAVLARVLVMALPQLGAQWSGALALMAALTMLLGNIAAVMQTSLKRMLAYSAIAHAGYALLGLAACTADGLRATAAYLTIYLCMNMGAFAIMGYLAVYGKKQGNNPLADAGEDLDDYTGLATRHPTLAAAMLVFLFSLTGIPPTAGFMGKFMLFKEAFSAGYTVTVLVAVISSTISAWYYLGVARRMYMQEAPANHPAPIQAASGGAGVRAVLLCCLTGVVLWGVFPQTLLSWVHVFF